jgi:hypothetical protein
MLVVEREARRAQRAAADDHARPPRQRPRRRIAFDGKVMRGARRPTAPKSPCSPAPTTTPATVVGQREIDAKTNEIP